MWMEAFKGKQTPKFFLELSVKVYQLSDKRKQLSID
jgi:hypothetical protein